MIDTQLMQLRLLKARTQKESQLGVDSPLKIVCLYVLYTKFVSVENWSAE